MHSDPEVSICEVFARAVAGLKVVGWGKEGQVNYLRPFNSKKLHLAPICKKHDGSLPLIGVNTFLPKDHGGDIATEIELIRSTPEEKGAQIANVKTYAEARNSLEP